MNKLIIGVIVVIVVAAGAYYLAVRGGGSPAPTATTETPSTNTTDTSASVDGTVAAPAPATASFDDFTAAMNADIAAQQAAVKSVDTSAGAAVGSVNTVTTSGQPYDPSSL